MNFKSDKKIAETFSAEIEKLVAQQLELDYFSRIELSLTERLRLEVGLVIFDFAHLIFFMYTYIDDKMRIRELIGETFDSFNKQFTRKMDAYNVLFSEIVIDRVEKEDIIISLKRVGISSSIEEKALFIKYFSDLFSVRISKFLPLLDECVEKANNDEDSPFSGIGKLLLSQLLIKQLYDLEMILNFDFAVHKDTFHKTAEIVQESI